MKELLLKKKDELEKSLVTIEQELRRLQEQVVMQRGALFYNDILLKELDEPKAEQKGDESKEEVK